MVGTIGLRGIFIRFGFLLVFAAFALFFAVVNPVFATGGNLMNIAEGSAILLIVALGMTLIVATGGIDLSVGIALDFGAAFSIVAMQSYGADWVTACAAGVIGGSLVGLLNAALVVGLRVSPFMATLGTFFIGSSVQRIFTNGGGPISFRQMPDGFRNLAMGNVGGVPMEVVIAAILAVIYFVVLERSVWGRRIHAMGMQRSAATVAGIRVNRILIVCYVAAAATCAVGGLIAGASIRMFTPLSGFAYLLDAIAAVFIGAALHPRGRPNVPGTIAGVLFLGMVVNGLNLMGLNFNTKDALSGIILVSALALAVAQRRMR
ncbi:ABC transporter permease [Palleronia sp. LCG004]|uniref:ABC transporter permease n=1 Tax=Palleronia sp. LCG004 TaxID=3079304 RepID=UPI00294280F1|nr:ABC transporter permease [Palleronia sp. LCG004]WOI56285.1 ABC transporter permease [Palleronia sp. LCG004]